MAIPNFPELERRILQNWQDKDVFGQTLNKPAPRGRFVFFDGPPTANGMPHIGHVETRAFKDLIPRFKTMQGYFVDRKAGWDTQGLPVEIEVEKALGISGKKQIEEYGVAKFNAAARQSVWKYKELWEKMTERIGFWLDLGHPYITYSNDYIETLWWIFKQAWDQKLLEQDFKVVPYCPRCGTALSSHEVAQGYEAVTEPSVYVKFELVDEPGTFVLAWTTTPWTLPGNVALAVDRKIDYVKVKGADGTKIILAKSLLNKLDEADRNIEQELTGADLVGKKYQQLFDFIDLRSHLPATPSRNESGTGSRAGGVENDSIYTIVPADFVTTDDGTGVVHTAVMYGIEDFDLGKKVGLPTVHTVDEQGRFNDLVKPWSGLEVRDAAGETQRKIVDWLKSHGQLYRVEDYTHDYPFCWRCKSPLLYYAKTSWFIRMSQLKNELIANNQKINWYPDNIKDGRFGEWLREVKDWAVSRERYWGTPLPIWSCDQCGQKECFGSYAELAAKVGTKNRYFVIRHGESTNNVAQTLDTELADGSAVLTETGEKQAREAAKKLKSEKINLIYTSQFPRATQTAAIIAQELKLNPDQDVRLNEYHIGPVFENKKFEEYHQQYKKYSYRFEHAPAGGETFVQVQQRIIKFFQQLERDHQGQNILVVTHADPILVLQWAARFQPPAAIDDIPYPKNGQVIPVAVPISIFNEDGLFDPHRPFVDTVTYSCAKCHQGTMRRTPEVADTWFDSGSMPFAQWHYPFENKDKIGKGEAYPADFISEAIDQTRGWFYTLLAVGTILQKAKVVKEPPFKNVVVLGHVMDAQGKKLSKSAGNYVDPMGAIDEFGADAVRWFLYTTNQPWDSKNFDPKIVAEGVRKTFLILLNVLSFWELYSHPTAASPQAGEVAATAASSRIKSGTSSQAGEVTPAVSSVTPPVPGGVGTDKPNHIMDRWLSSLTNALVRDVTERLEQYDLTTAARRIADYVTDLSTWYVRRSRDRMKGDDGAVVASNLQAVLLVLSKLMAPFTPFLAEELYHRAGGTLDSVHLEEWPTAGEIDEKLLTDMKLARTVVEQALSLRAGAGIKVRQPLSQLVVTTALRPDLDEVVRAELNVKELQTAEKLPTGTDWAVGENIALDISISDELREEGWCRDLVREFNALRKKAGLQPADTIIVHCEANSMAAKIIERFGASFLQDVRAKAATPSMDGATHKAELKLGEESSMVGVAKV